MKSEWFVEVDAAGEPTLWLRRAEHPDAPLAVIRRCDLAPKARHLWPLLPSTEAAA